MPMSPVTSMEDDSILTILEELYIEAQQGEMILPQSNPGPPSESSIVHTSFRPKFSFFPYWAKGTFSSTFYDVVFESFKIKFHHGNKNKNNKHCDPLGMSIDSLKQTSL